MPNKSNDVVIVDAVRTPFGRLYGSLSHFDTYDLGAIPIREVVKRAGVPGKMVGEVFWGIGDTSCSPVAARQSLIKAGLPHETSSISFDMAGVSAIHAVKLATMAMKLGEIDCAIAGGATSFSRNPVLLERLRQSGFNPLITKNEYPPAALNYQSFNQVAKECDAAAKAFGVDRVEQDEWAYRSHLNYGKAWNAGKFKDEIFPLLISLEDSVPANLDIDEAYRPNITLDRLAHLENIYGTRTVTSGNAAHLSDGATAILLMTREKAVEAGVQPLATVVTSVSLAINTGRTVEAPGYAIQMACKKASLNLDDIDVIEINEDFACVPLITLRIVAGEDRKKLQTLKEKTNINGSALAAGHPTTATGARIVMNLMYEMRRRGGGYALGTLSGGLAQADACIIRVD